jgi:hypothetical protein
MEGREGRKEEVRRGERAATFQKNKIMRRTFCGSTKGNDVLYHIGEERSPLICLQGSHRKSAYQ